MNQGEIEFITYRVDSSGAITAMSNVQKKDAREREKSQLDSNQNMAKVF